MDIALSNADPGKIGFRAGDAIAQPRNNVSPGYAGAEGRLKAVELTVGLRF